MSAQGNAAIVRVRDDAKSQFAGETLRVVKIERKAGRTTFLCQMPGYPYPGWFSAKEVDGVVA